MSLCSQYDSLFLLDFATRYAVDRCNSPDDVDIAIMSITCVLPLFVWISCQILLLLQAEIYLMMARCTLTILTLLQVIFLYIFQRGPPVVGCGPSKSFPATQMSLCSYLMVTVMCYGRDFRPHSLITQFAMLLLFAWTAFSIMHIGFSDSVSCIAGSILGSVTASTFHEMVLFVTYDRPNWFARLVWYVELLSGKAATNTVLSVETETAIEEYKNISTNGVSNDEYEGECREHKEICMGF